MYKLREEPVHGKIEQADHKHPLYGRYLNYRAAMSAQLVRCPSFKDWVRREEEDEDY